MIPQSQYGMILGSKKNRPRPANSNQQNFNPNLTMVSIINPTSLTWNSHIIRSLGVSEDEKIIKIYH